MFTVMDFVPRGELFTAWKRLEHFSEALVRICIAELAIAIGESALNHTDFKFPQRCLASTWHYLHTYSSVIAPSYGV